MALQLVKAAGLTHSCARTGCAATACMFICAPSKQPRRGLVAVPEAGSIAQQQGWAAGKWDKGPMAARGHWRPRLEGLALAEKPPADTSVTHSDRLAGQAVLSGLAQRRPDRHRPLATSRQPSRPAQDPPQPPQRTQQRCRQWPSSSERRCAPSSRPSSSGPPAPAPRRRQRRHGAPLRRRRRPAAAAALAAPPAALAAAAEQPGARWCS